MNNLTPELIEKVKAAKSAEELAEIIKANNITFTEEEKKSFYDKLNANGAVSDDDLNAVAGGLSLIADLENLWKNRKVLFEILENAIEAGRRAF